MSVDTLKCAGHTPHILITGLPGVGKTTLIRKLVKHLAEHNPAGFYTEEIRDAQGTREGFRLVTLCGRQLSCPTFAILDLTVSAATAWMSTDSSSSWLNSTSGTLSRG